MKRPLCASTLLLLLALSQGALPVARGQEKPATPAKPKTLPADASRQDLDDPLAPLEPVKPRSAAAQAKVEALSWYAAGQILEDRDAPAALNAYKKAIQLDPQALPVYRAMIPIAFSLNLNDEAIKWALKAVELEPGNYQLLLRLAEHQFNQGDFAGATKLFEQATKVPDLKKESPLHVLLMRNLAGLYHEANRHADAANAYEIVFDAMQNPEKYHLDFRTRAQLMSDAAAVYEKMGQAFLDAKRSKLAISAFEKAAESKKGNPGNLSYNLAQVFVQSDQAEKALEELQKYFDAQRQSKGRAAYELLAETLKKLGKSAELIPRLEALAEKDARNSILQYYLADQYLAAKRLDDAEKLYRKTLASASELQGYVGLAAVYRQQNKPAELLDTLGKGYAEVGELDGLQAEIKSIVADEKLVAAMIEAGRKRMQEQPSKLDFATGYVLANIAADAKKTAESEQLYRYLLDLRKERAGLLYKELGGLLTDAKRFADAAKVFEEAANDPALADDKTSFIFFLAQALEMGGNTKGALDALAVMRQALPDHPLLQYQEAWVYYHAHQFDEAIKRFEKFIAAFPQAQFKKIVMQAQFSLSNIYVLQGDLRKGEAILEVVYKENPDLPSVNNDLGYLYADQGKNLEQAEKMIKKAIASEPDNGAYLDSMGWVLFKLGKAAEALPFLEKAVKNSTGGDETLWDHLGDVHQSLQQSDKAQEAWQKGLKAAKESARPDKKLIERLEAKLKK